MTVPFWCLIASIIIPQVLSGIRDYFRKQQFGFADNHHPRSQYPELTGAGARAHAAEQNASEALPVFAIAVFVAHLAGADPGLSSTASVLYVVCRLLHAAFYVADLSTLRSTVYLLGLTCCGWLFALAFLA